MEKPTTTSPAPETDTETIAGWVVRRDDGMYLAERGGLSVYQREHGCLSTFQSRSRSELLLVLDAQRVLAEELLKAETVYKAHLDMRRARAAG